MLRSAALWWERSHHRQKERAEFIKSYGRDAYKLLKLRMLQAREEEARHAANS